MGQEPHGYKHTYSCCDHLLFIFRKNRCIFSSVFLVGSSSSVLKLPFSSIIKHYSWYFDLYKINTPRPLSCSIIMMFWFLESSLTVSWYLYGTSSCAYFWHVLGRFVFNLDNFSSGTFDMSLKSPWRNCLNSASILALFKLDGMRWSNPYESAISSSDLHVIKHTMRNYVAIICLTGCCLALLFSAKLTFAKRGASSSFLDALMNFISALIFMYFVFSFFKQSNFGKLICAICCFGNVILAIFFCILLFLCVIYSSVALFLQSWYCYFLMELYDQDKKTI